MDDIGHWEREDMGTVREGRSRIICFILLTHTDTQTSIDSIKCDITVQVFALQDGVCERVSVCVRACAVEIKSGMLRVSLMYAFRRAYRLTYKMVTFIAAKGLFNTVCCVEPLVRGRVSKFKTVRMFQLDCLESIPAGIGGLPLLDHQSFPLDRLSANM